MRDRAKIVVNNREVAKRYLGSRLVWEEESLLKIDIKNLEIKVYSSFIAFQVENNSYKFNNKKIKKISINNLEPIDIDVVSQTPELTTYNMYLNDVTEKIKRYFITNGASTSDYTRMNITFYVE